MIATVASLPSLGSLRTARTIRPLSLRCLGTVAGIALVYFGAAKFGLSLAVATKQVTAVWPPTGIALAAYVVFGRRIWPGVYLGALVANMVSDEPLATAAGIAAGNTLAGIVGVTLLRRVPAFQPSLRSVRDVLALIICGAAAGSVVSASNGVAQLALGGVIPWSAYAAVWPVWWVGDAMGVLLVGAVGLTWAPPPRGRPQPWRPLLQWQPWRSARAAEAAVLFVALAAVCDVALGGQVVETTALFRLEYTVFPFVIWAALRFGQRGAAAAILLVAAMAIWGATNDRGPFAAGTLDQRLILLEAFMAVTAVAGLTLGAVTAERTRAQRELRRAHDTLERRVAERTAQLAAANQELARKNEEVEAFVYIVSHDLRGPLVNLQGFAQELETSCRELQQSLQPAALPPSAGARVRAILDDDLPGALRYIRASTSKFQRLIDALLALSRYGRQDYHSGDVDVQALVGATLDCLRQSIEQAGAMVSVGALPEATGDATALGQVFANLLGNALRYRHPDRPARIEVGGETAGSTVHYWVRDNGDGIPASAQPRLFQVFQRFHPQVAEGEGMGLAIVKRVVERHGGRVWAESEEGRGTTVHLTLAAARPAPAALAAGSGEAP